MTQQQQEVDPAVWLEEVRRAWLAVKEWIGPYASVEQRNAIDELETLIGVYEERRRT